MFRELIMMIGTISFAIISISLIYQCLSDCAFIVFSIGFVCFIAVCNVFARHGGNDSVR